MFVNPANPAPTNSAKAVTDSRLPMELDFLFQRINYEQTVTDDYPKHFKLETMRNLLDRLGNPQDDYGIIHVAGTKGKGSVSRMISGALNEAGIKTGVYSSPHIESICERISVGDKLITETELADILQSTRQIVNELDREADANGTRKCSFFEIITAAGLIFFKQSKVEKVVLEVGLGGRLDSTNVCQPELCIITNISLDHTKQLGSTVDKIAREKAGIIKPGIPVVSGVKDPLAAREIQECCSVCHSDLMELDEDFFFRITDTDDVTGQIGFETWGGLPERHSYRLDNANVQAAGLHQVTNAALAVAALNLLNDRFRISNQAIREAMANFRMIGRGEVLSRKPLVIVDMAHNVASIEALVEMLRRLSSSKVRQGCRRLVFGSSRDKDLKGMMTKLLPFFDEVVFTRFVENPRATEPEELLSIAEATALEAGSFPRMTVRPDPQTAWALVDAEMTPDDLICVAGSAFLVAEMRPMIRTRLNLMG